MRTTRPVLLLALLVVVGACSLLPAGGADAEGEPYPAGCAAYGLSEHRCKAIVEELAARLDVDRAAVAGIELLGDPGCGTDDPNVLCTRTTSFVVRVRFHLADGRSLEDSVFCGVGGQHSILCTESPEIRVSSPMLGGYHDVPCAGEPPDGCASPVPTIDPATAADAAPLVVPELDVVLDRVGEYRIEVGDATLPNGILRDAAFTLADLHPTTFATTEEGVRLEVLPGGPGGDPLWNLYEHGWRKGLERVSVILVFEITSFEPGATLEVRDLIVR
jgi:hypothetical protein